jgi:type II secretory pathway pseudopilin PulG
MAADEPVTVFGGSRPMPGALARCLVVIGIVSVLIALLFPALTSARVKADSVNCASRLRQLYAYTVMFADEHKQYLPRPTWVGETVTTQPDPKFQEWSCWMQDPSAVAGKISFESGGLWRYVPEGTREAVVTCPADRGEPAQHLGKLYPRNFSYSFNGNLRAVDSWGRPSRVNLAAVKGASEKILIYEEMGPCDAWGLANLSTDDYPSARHGTATARVTGRQSIGADYFYGGRGNHCFFDGHVQQLSPSWILNPDHAGSWGPLD